MEAHPGRGYNWRMAEEEVTRLRGLVREDRKLIQRAAQALAEIDRADGLSEVNADVLAALRIRLEGKERASLEELLTVVGDIEGKKDLRDIVDTGGDKSSEWPDVEEKKRDWPGS